MKKFLTILFSLIAAVGIVMFSQKYFGKISELDVPGIFVREKTILPQKVERVTTQAGNIHKVYHNGQLVGIISDEGKLDRFLKQKYKEEYADQYPDSHLILDTDMYITHEQSYFVYENIDDSILEYVEAYGLYAIHTTAVEFAENNHIYAQIYVAEESLYHDALEQYLSYFVDPTELALLNHGQDVPALKTYGSRTVGLSILQTITVKEAYAKPSEIMTTVEEVLEYLEYGEETEKEYYTVEKYDTVAGVGWKNHGLSATQVLNINSDKLTSVDQVLSEGMELCVTYFKPVIDVVVNKESMKKEIIYPETIYMEDESIRVGVVEQKQVGVNGSKNSLYLERWINGVLVSGTLQSSVDTLRPVNEIIAVGTLEIPGVGTGTFRWPVDNPYISCGWGCYWGHQAIDVQNAYDHWGNIYAADRGVIIENSYNWISGNYVYIDHNNGYISYYGHMNVPSPLPVGTIVDKGDIIGQLGMTGRATGPHTHFWIGTDYNNKLNPCMGFLDCEVIR